MIHARDLTLVLLMLFGIGVASLSYALAVASKHDGSLFYMVSHSVALPMMLLGGVLLMEAERALFTGEVWTLPVLYGALVATGVAASGLAIGVSQIRKASL